MSLLTIERLSVAYGDVRAVDDVSLSVAPGEVVGLVGESGSGKSSVALAAIGLLPAGARTTGAVRLGGIDMAALGDAARDGLRGGTVGMVFQEPMTALNPVMTIAAQVAETIRLHHRGSRRAALAEAGAVLARVGLAPERVPPGRYPHELSGGQRQRVAIAIAIAARPKLLIADEPTTALDVTTQAHVVALLKHLVAEEGLGLLLVSHDLALVAGAADRIVVMSRGKVVEEGVPATLLTAPRDPYTRALLARARHVPQRRSTPDRDGAPLLEVRGVLRDYPGVRRGFRRAVAQRAVDGVGFTVMRGETVGLVGESGSGKTTLARTVLALDRPQAGEVLLHGESLTTATGPALRRLRRDIQAVFQDPAGSFDPRHRVARIVAEPLHLLDARPSTAERERRVAAALDQVGLTAAEGTRHPHALSGGQRQRVAIARALIVEPALIVLDEAVSALDVAVRADILDLLAELSDRLRLSYLFVSHDLNVMRSVADRLLVMRAGRIVEQGATADLVARPRHPYTAELLAATPDLGRLLPQA